MRYENESDENKAAVDLEERKISFFVEGMENEVWNEYIAGKKDNLVNLQEK